MKKGNTIWILAVVFCLLIPLQFVVPIINGSTQLLIVLSGSMHPIMLVGDMVVINQEDPEKIVVGDIIAYRDPGGAPDVLITHRVIGISREDELLFKTKGDANEDEDGYVVPASKLVGRAVSVIPFAGYLPETTKKPGVFILMVMIPALLIIIDEIMKINKYNNPMLARKEEKAQRKQKRVPARNLRTARLLGLVMACVLCFGWLALPGMLASGSVQPDQTIQNKGVLPGVYTIRPVGAQYHSITTPSYGILPPSGEITINEPASISMSPYVLPVFWINIMGGRHPYLPGIVTIVIYTGLLSLGLIPLWYQKPAMRKRKKRSKHRFLSIS